MNNLVIMKNNQVVTTSLQVAATFGKNHRDVLSAIDDLKKGVAGNYADLFYDDSYIHPQNKQTYRQVIMNRDGFTLLAMGFTGKKALQFKLKYIDAFNQMEKQLKANNKALSLPEQIKTIALGYTQMEEDVADIKTDLSDVRDRMGLPGNMKRTFSKARNRKVIELMGGSKSNAYLDKSLRQKAYSQMFASFKEQFQVDSYADCPMKNFDDAIEFVNNWFAPYELQQRIQQLNSQTGLFDGNDQ
ncbi:phage regulatory protein [Ligilactobacillus pobuzihii]|uniref:Rha family transcriptional regulator n=1 Tax=Ligilactobacillus pobuzihii TaxID=449659 RepID=UPI0019CF5DB7|nr:Rha family transcriptional regulator [Ligilactobacillus pobuzihii]MBN7275545.1 phage regulatory protein [Ligilactobacillus pobuzihii]